MLLKFAGVRKQYAVGLRWAVDDRSGIEAIQFNTDLHYGIMLNVEEKINRKLKIVALADASHNKAICLAGLLASQYSNLILVHRVSDVNYWICIIKQNSVWSGMDVPKATAGDFVGNHSVVSTVLEAAKEEFNADGIDIEDILLVTDTASEDYPEAKTINLSQFVSKLKNNKHCVIRYFQPSKVFLRKIIIFLFFIIILGVVSYYIYQQRLLMLLLHQQQIEQERQQQIAIQAEKDYFFHLQEVIHHQEGAIVLKNIFSLLQRLPLQSRGWELTSATYNPQSPTTLNLQLKRTPFGTLDSFLLAYSGTQQNGTIQSDNNSGWKQFNVSDLPLVISKTNVPEKLLTQSIPTESYRLISFMQLHTDLYVFQLTTKSPGKYNVYATNFEIKGSALWQLMQLQETLMAFPTLIINKINFMVSNYDMAWTIEGTIYA